MDISQMLQALAMSQQVAANDSLEAHGKIDPANFALNPMPGLPGNAAPRASMVPRPANDRGPPNVGPGSPRGAAQDWVRDQWFSKPEGNTTSIVQGIKARSSADESARRSSNLQQTFAENPGSVTHTLPNGYMVGHHPNNQDFFNGGTTNYSLLSPQGRPVLYGSSPHDLVKRGFHDEEHAPLLQSLPPMPAASMRPARPEMPDAATVYLNGLRAKDEADRRAWQGLPPADNVVPFPGQ